MSDFLVTTTEVYRVESEEAAEYLINTAKEDNSYALTKYNCEHKQKTSKGEIIDEWYKVTLTKRFNDEKDPGTLVKVTYEVK